MFKQIGGFAQKRGLRFLKELELARLGDFRSEWKDGPRSSLKKLERLRAFLRFCERRKWIESNPALDLKAPKITNRPTLPFRLERIKENKLFPYTQKTGVAVQCVPDFVICEIEAAPKSSKRYFFWTGESKLHTAVGIWQRKLQGLFELAEVQEGHAHRFRDTFAAELLLSGVPLERVSVLLGHQSVRITERHYAPWVRSRGGSA